MKKNKNIKQYIDNFSYFVSKFIQIVLFILLYFSIIELKAQDYPYDITMYTFVKYNKNILNLPQKQDAYNKLFDKLTKVGIQGKGRVSIAHIGDSHIQADFLSGTFRKKLQTFFKNSVSGRGFVFPYKTAHTNNPLNYKVHTKGKWEVSKNIKPLPKYELGTAGIAVITTDTTASISINVADTLIDYTSNYVMIFYDNKPECFLPRIINPKPIKQTINSKLGYILFEFAKPTDNVTIGIQKTNDKQKYFNLQGVNFTSMDNGIIYHTFGVNGATFKSFLKCNYFEKHLSAINPDLVIVSLGTNDVYVNKLNTEKLTEYIDKLINEIKKAVPNSAILFTTPGDHLMFQHKINKNTVKAANIIKQKAKQYQFAYWDFNNIMGGEGSIYAWYDTQMAHTDFLHYTRKGYEYQGILLFNAFLKSYDKFVKKNNENNKKTQ